MKCIHSTRVYNRRQTEFSRALKCEFGVLRFHAGSSVPLWLCLLYAVHQTKSSRPPQKRLTASSRRHLSNGFTTWQFSVARGASGSGFARLGLWACSRESDQAPQSG